jgi:phage gpG-like protein
MMLVVMIDDENVLFAVDTLSERVQNFEPVWRQIAKDLMELEEQIFATQGSVIGKPWAPLSPKTIRQKQRKGFPLEPLVRTGRLRASLTDETSGEMILDIDPLGLTFGSARPVDRGDWWLAPIHHFGAPRRNIPARALMPDNQFLVGRYRERWQDYFLNYLSEEKKFL